LEVNRTNRKFVEQEGNDDGKRYDSTL